MSLRSVGGVLVGGVFFFSWIESEDGVWRKIGKEGTYADYEMLWVDELVF